MVDAMIIVGSILLLLLVRSCLSVWRHTTLYDQHSRAYWKNAEVRGTQKCYSAACALRTFKRMLDIKIRKAVMYCMLLVVAVVWTGLYFIQLGDKWQGVFLIIGVVIYLWGIKKSRAFHREVKGLHAQFPYLVSTLYQGLAGGLSIRDILGTSVLRGPKFLRPFLQRCCLLIDRGDRVSTVFDEVFADYHLMDFSFLSVFLGTYEDMGDVVVSMLKDYDIFVTRRQVVDERWKKAKMIILIVLLALLALVIYLGNQLVRNKDFDLQASFLFVWQTDWARDFLFLCLGAIALLGIIIVRTMRVVL